MNRINRRLIVLALPFIVGFLMFYIVPLIGAIRYSFVESAFNQRFVGWDNYAVTLSNHYFRLSVGNTLILIIFGVPILVTVSLCLALLVKDKSNQLPILRASLVLPMFLPSAAITNVFTKLPFEDPRISLLAIYIWKNAGFLTLIFLAAFAMIPKTIYEAAVLDGAGKSRILFSVTLPLISGAILFSVVLAVSNNLRLFREAYLLYGSYPDTRVYLTQHYMNNHFYKLNYQKLTTASILFTVVLFAFVWINIRFSKRYSEECD